MALVQEGTASDSILSLLTNDHDASVADLAKTASYRRSQRIRRPLTAAGATPLPAGDPEQLLTDQDVRHG